MDLLFLMGTVIVGVLMFSEDVCSNSLSLGIPRVTLTSPLPAKWKVFRVICVDGSPIDCDVISPIYNK